MAHNAIEIANRIILLSNPEIGDILSNLKLQKLLYYVQGFNLAIYNQPIFNEDIYAWQYGPVVIEVYNHFKKYGSGHIPVEKIAVKVNFTEQEEELILKVWHLYGQFSAFKLMQLTNEESPWETTEIDQIITHQKMKEYFLTQINKI